ncbi:Gfo/Idh/MocA family protein [Paenibacillus sp. strain BS8-2]
MSESLKLGLIGLDTSHVIKFAEVLNDSKHPHYVPGARIIAGYKGGSSDISASYSRVDGFAKQLEEQYGVGLLNRPEEVAEACDALLITSVDGRVHLPQFRSIVSYRKPIFIDKPFTCSLQEAEEMYRIAAEYGVPIMSCSVLRYLDPLLEALKIDSNVIGIDCYTPMALEPTNPGWFWYGIHGAEMLFRVLGTNCTRVHATNNELYEFAIGEWTDGRFGTVRGNRTGNYHYGATLHYANRSQPIQSMDSKKPMVATLVERIVDMFRNGQVDVSAEETLEIIRFIEGVNRSRESKIWVQLR